MNVDVAPSRQIAAAFPACEPLAVVPSTRHHRSRNKFHLQKSYLSQSAAHTESRSKGANGP